MTRHDLLTSATNRSAEFCYPAIMHGFGSGPARRSWFRSQVAAHAAEVRSCQSFAWRQQHGEATPSTQFYDVNLGFMGQKCANHPIEVPPPPEPDLPQPRRKKKRKGAWATWHPHRNSKISQVV